MATLPPPPLPPNSPPVPLPLPPHDPNVLLPAAPVFPPTMNNVLGAVNYCRGMDMSIAVAPPWFQAAMQQLWGADIVPDIKWLMNQHRGNGTVMPFEIIPFTTGAQPPNHLPPLHSVNAIENLTGNQLTVYLTGYGVIPLPGANPHATNHLQKEILKEKIGVCMM